MRDKITFDDTKETLYESLGISEERFLEITDHAFCGLPEDHSVDEHIVAVNNREDVTDAEMLIVMFDLGLKSAYSRMAMGRGIGTVY